MENFDDLFDPIITYPDPDMLSRFNALVGIDDMKEDLSKMLSILVHPEGLKKWQDKHHFAAESAVEMVLRRPPLVVLAGDVGSGKTELATTIGDSVARKENISVRLFPLSLSARGQGRVGEMTKLITEAFDYVIEEAKKLQGGRGSVILLVDEADALAQSREESQMHHEDRAGVNAFIRGIDRIANEKLPAAVIMCTNRPSALDPAVQRRATRIFKFGRPDKEKRQAILSPILLELGLKDDDINKIVDATGGDGKDKIGCTFSDLTQRLIPEIILDAYPDSKVTAERSLEIAQNIQPTAKFTE